MKDRLFKILRSMVDDDPLLFRVASVEEFDEGVLEISIVPHPLDEGDDNWFSDHRTFVRFDVFSDGQKLSLNIEHVWGWLDTDLPAGDVGAQMIQAFKENTRTWHASGYFLGMREYDGTNLLTLNCSNCFLTRWSDEDIRELLRQRIFELGSAFMTYDPSLTAFRNYYEGE